MENFLNHSQILQNAIFSLHLLICIAKIYSAKIDMNRRAQFFFSIPFHIFTVSMQQIIQHLDVL